MELKVLQNDENWSFVLGLLPDDLEASARQFKVFTRKREIRSAEDLLRMILVYAVTDLSMQSVCAWASAVGMASMSKPAFFYRMKDCTGWLMHLLRYVLNSKDSEGPSEGEGFRVKIVDATCVQGPGAQGTEWRIHARITVDSSEKRWRMESLQITDELVGENYGMHSSDAEELVMGDRGYGTAKSIFYAREEGAQVVVRITPSNIRVCNTKRQVTSVEKFEKLVPEEGCYSMHIQIPVPPSEKTKSKKPWSLKKAMGWIPARLIGCRNDKGEVVWIITTLPKSFMNDDEEYCQLLWMRMSTYSGKNPMLHLLPESHPQISSLTKPWE